MGLLGAPSSTSFGKRDRNLARAIISILAFLFFHASPTFSAIAGEFDAFVKYKAPEPTTIQLWWRRLIGKTEARNIVLIAGITDYTNLGITYQLTEVETDIENIRKIFVDTQGFDEVLILKNREFNDSNLEGILTRYLPQVFANAPGSRFVFAFSGHGFSRKSDSEGFLLKSNATALDDATNSISFEKLRHWLHPLTAIAHQTLVLINACESGSFFAARVMGVRDASTPEDMFYPGHWVLTASRDTQSALGARFGDTTHGTLFYEVFYDAIARAQAARINNNGEREKFVNFFDFTSYMRSEISRKSGGRMFPTPGALEPGGWAGAFVFTISNTPTIADARTANTQWKVLGARQFRGQITYLLDPVSFNSADIIGDNGWFDQGTLVNRVETSSRRPRTQAPLHIVIGYTFSPGGPNSKLGIRDAYRRGKPGSVHVVVYKDRSIDQFVSLSDAAHAIGNGTVGNDNAITIWLDSAGVLAGKTPSGDAWQTYTEATLPATRVIELEPKSFARPSRHLLDDQSCTFAPVTRGWEKYPLRELEAAESVIDQVIMRYEMPKSSDTILALNEIRCGKFAPGPQLNPWITCLKQRTQQGASMGGCAREAVSNSVIP
jgi:N-acetyl-anhydromuramyl-L-alanine amidase AmpD